MRNYSAAGALVKLRAMFKFKFKKCFIGNSKV